MLRQLDESGVQRVMLVALAGHIENRYVLEVCNRNPERLVACPSFNPAAYGSPSEAQLAIRNELKVPGYRALKIHPRFNHYDPLDLRCLAMFEEIARSEKPLPIWLDTMFYYRGGSLRKPPVDTIHEIVCTFPNLTFVLLHGGGSWLLQVAEAVRDCPNAYVDISFTIQRFKGSSIANDIRCLVETFDRRLTWGSDFPEYGLKDSLDLFNEITKGLPEEKRANVLGGNLARIIP